MKTKTYPVRIGRCILGQAFTGTGVVFMLHANIGLEPWSVLQQGIHLVTGISFGTAAMLVSLGIILMDVLLGEQIGIGTFISAFLCGVFIDGIDALNLIQTQSELLSGIGYMLIGLELLVLGTWLYMGAALGCGARDAMMVALSKRSRFSPGMCRIGFELLAILVGWLMGGQVGIGTVMSAVGIGTLIDLNFRLLRFSAVDIRHENLLESVQKLNFCGNVS